MSTTTSTPPPGALRRQVAEPRAPGALEGGPAEGARTPRLRTLDGLRFVAALGVVAYHWTAFEGTVWGGSPSERFPVLGHVAVYFSLGPELFFVLSGFVILWTAWGRTAGQVVASRLARVYPAYWGGLVLTSLLLLVLWPTAKALTWGDALVNVTLLQEAVGARHVDGVYWTLWTELRFYALVVLMVAIGLTRRRLLVAATVWPAAAVVGHLAGWGPADTVLLGAYAPLFAGGMLLFLLHRDGHAPLPWALLAGNVVLAVVALLPGHLRTLARTTAYAPHPVLLGVVLAACFATVAALTLLPRAWLAPLDRPWLTSLGGLTYPIYLVHQFWGWWVIHRLHDTMPDAVVLLVAASLVAGLAVLVHHGVERRLNPPMRRGIERALQRLGVRCGDLLSRAAGARRRLPAAASHP